MKYEILTLKDAQVIGMSRKIAFNNPSECPRFWEFPDTPLEEIPSVAERFGSMLSEMKEAGAQHLIIDLRGNGGGWSPIVYPVLYQLYGDEYLTTDLECHYET